MIHPTGDTQRTPPGLPDSRQIKRECHCHRKERAELGFCGVFYSKRVSSVWQLTPEFNILTHSAVWVQGCWGFCKRSVKCTDGNNLAFASNPEDGCFYSLDFLWCQRRRCRPESLPADCNCCQRFITFCMSGFLIANWNILDSRAQERFPSCFFLPPRKGPSSPSTAQRFEVVLFPECVQINPKCNWFSTFRQLSFPGCLGSVPTLSCSGERLVWTSMITLSREMKNPHWSH